jgi:membrane fusion protein, heavy metal efflux system
MKREDFHRLGLQLPAAVAGTIALLAIAGGAVTLFDSGGTPAAAPAAAVAPPPGTFRPTAEQLAGLTIEPVRLVTFRSELKAEGDIALDGNLTTPVFSPYSGRVVRLFARLGDHVARGAPLFAVEASEYVQAANDLIAAVAAERTARSQLMQAQINERRAHQLYLAKGGALKDWQQSRTDLAAADNALSSAEMALAAARNRLRILGRSESQIAALESRPTQKLDPVAVVTAPIAGIVLQRQIGLGQYIQSGGDTPVYTIGNLATVWLVANVREDEAPLMRAGAPVAVTVPAFPGRVFDARISWVASELDANTHRLKVRADVANPDGALKPRMFADFTIITGPAVTRPAVPPEAIVHEGDAARVWLMRPDGTLARRIIKTGRIQDGMVAVIGGLKAGDRVVTSGSLFIDRAARGG